MVLFSENIQKFKAYLVRAEKIVIISHKDPDGDAIGSSLAWYNVLNANGFDVKVISPNEVPGNLHWMQGGKKIISFTRDPERAISLLSQAQLILILDFNKASRIGAMEEHVFQLQTPKVMIDHHPFPNRELADVVFSDTSVSSTCELSYKVIKSLNLNIDLKASECLYTGIITDTGMLDHNSSHPEIYRIIAELLDSGMDKEKAHNFLYHSNSFSRIKLIGHALCNRFVLLPSKKAAYIILYNEDLKSHNYKPGDTEDLVNFPLTVKGVEVSALITEREPGRIKISFRSRGNIAVNKYAAEYFNGGGHHNAAGGEYKGSIEQALKLYKKTIENIFN